MATSTLGMSPGDVESVLGISPGAVTGGSGAGAGAVTPVDGISPAIAVAESAHDKAAINTKRFIVIFSLKFEDARQLAIIQITAKE